jgi:hypothetical protein
MTLQEAPADQRTAEGQDRFVDRRQPFVPEAPSPELGPPGARAVHDPAIPAPSTAVRRAALGQLGSHAARTEGTAGRGGIVAAVAVEAVRPAAGAAPLPADGRGGLDQRHEGGDVMCVSPGQQGGPGDTLGCRAEVMRAPQLPSLRRMRACLRPPQTARTDDESTAARDQSRGSAPRRVAKSTPWRRRQTPARGQARRDRPQVIPEPQPSSWGSLPQGSPRFNTHKMPVSTRRGAQGFRPGQRPRRGLGGGNNGAIGAHTSASSPGLAMWNPPKSRGDTGDIHRNQEEAQSFC